jgi:hypothetical protein
MPNDDLDASAPIVANRADLFLRFDDRELYLGEFEVHKLSRRGTSQLPGRLILKIREDLSPQPSGRAGREYAFLFKLVSELTDEEEREHTSMLATGEIGH